MKLGVYVGSFDPVHIGHKKVIDYLLENNYVDKMIVIPTVNYWDKTNLTNQIDRINMLKYYETDKIKIVKKEEPYTYQILESLKKEYPKEELYLIIGADNLEKFHLWQHVDFLLQNKIIVLPRGNTNIQKYRNKKSFVFVRDFDYLNISSTEIRKAIKEKNLEIKKCLNPSVYEYIIKNNLYKEREEKE